MCIFTHGLSEWKESTQKKRATKKHTHTTSHTHKHTHTQIDAYYSTAFRNNTKKITTCIFIWNGIVK